MASSEPFDPEGVTWMHVSPKLAGARRVVALIMTLVPAVASAVLAVILGWNALWLLTALFVLLVLWQWWLIGRQVRSWGYAEREDDLLVRHGLMFREIVVVPYGRMQYVDVQAGPLDRAFGIAKVQLHTASAGTDAVIPGLPPAEAARLRDRLASRGQAQLAGL
jgi:membrane protein YdbS with pleckstrin-like domain